MSSNGIISREIREMAADAWMEELPSTLVAQERCSPQPDASGGTVDEWATIRTFRARIRKAKGQREAVVGEQVQAAVDCEMVCDPYPDDLPAWQQLRPADRIVDGTTVYEVIGDDNGITGDILLTVQLVKIEGDS
jgi:head-tail adaptor